MINTAEKARALVDEFRSPSLGIVLDGANLIREDRFGEMEVVFQTAVELLGDHLLMVHAKDIPIESGGSQAAGQGQPDWRSYFVSLQSVGFVGPIILHNLSPRRGDRESIICRKHMAGMFGGKGLIDVRIRV